MPPVQGDIGWPRRSSAGDLPWWYVYGRAGRLTSSATTPAQTQSSDLTHANIYVGIKLGLRTGPILLIQSCKIYTTKRNNRITRSPGVDPILMMS